MTTLTNEASAIVSAVVPIAMRDELERLAHDADRSLSSEIRRGLRTYLERLAETAHDHQETPS